MVMDESYPYQDMVLFVKSTKGYTGFYIEMEFPCLLAIHNVKLHSWFREKRREKWEIKK
jgi:hypothetical protein